MDENKFDVIIIGAGIGGLVCGCMLAKSGLKVLIVERSASLGGYCNTFKVRDLEFDGCVHSLGNISKGSDFYKILEDLKILSDLDLIQNNPSDTVVAVDCQISFWNDIKETINELSENFPDEAKAINYFFLNILYKENLDAVISFRAKTFQSLLDALFKDYRLKSILSLFIFGDCGVPSYHISAFTAIKHYRQFILNGGFCPREGIGVLPNSLAKRFISLGGTLKFPMSVIEILTGRDNMVEGVKLKDNSIYFSKYVVSNCDARQTFFELIGKKKLSENIVETLSASKPSLSLFITYLGLGQDSKRVVPDGTNRWHILDYNYQEEHKNKINYHTNIQEIKCFLVCPNYEKTRLTIFTSAPFISEEFWEKYRDEFMDLTLRTVEKTIPGIMDSVRLKTCMTPVGLKKWTLNYNGAAYGWAGTTNQIVNPLYSRDKIIKNLFLCGHWSSLAAGVPGVSIVGQKVANIILNRIGIKNKLSDNISP